MQVKVISYQHLMGTHVTSATIEQEIQLDRQSFAKHIEYLNDLKKKYQAEELAGIRGGVMPLKTHKKVVSDARKTFATAEAKVREMSTRLDSEKSLIDSLQHAVEASRAAAEAALHQYAAGTLPAEELEELQAAAEKAKRQWENHRQAGLVMEDHLKLARQEEAEAHKKLINAIEYFWKLVKCAEGEKLVAPLLRVLAANGGFSHGSYPMQGPNFAADVVELVRVQATPEAIAKVKAALAQEYGVE